MNLTAHLSYRSFVPKKQIDFDPAPQNVRKVSDMTFWGEFSSSLSIERLLHVLRYLSVTVLPICKVAGLSDEVIEAVSLTEQETRCRAVLVKATDCIPVDPLRHIYRRFPIGQESVRCGLCIRKPVRETLS